MKQDIENCLVRVTEIMEREKDNLYRYACYRLGSPEEAEDLLQDLYLAMHSKRSALRNVDRLDSYIYRSLSNACASTADGRSPRSRRSSRRPWRRSSRVTDTALRSCAKRARRMNCRIERIKKNNQP